jgi:threonyl-tRNA synthetase
MAAAVTNLFPGTQCGIGLRPTKGSSTSSSTGRSCPRIDAIERKMKELAAADLPYERQMWPREERSASSRKG